MAWSCGIVGLPNAGKSTLFKALTALDITIESYPFSTINPNKAVVSLPDQRLNALAELSNAGKITPATIDIFDVAGLVEGASRGEGLGNQFLGHLRDVDLLIHVVGGFEEIGEDLLAPEAKISVVNLELILADLEVLSRRRQKLEPKLKSGEKAARKELNLLSRLEEFLNQGCPLRNLNLSREELSALSELPLLTLKEMIYVYNLPDDLFVEPDISFFPSNSPVISMSARLEAELADLPSEERKPFMEAYGLEKSRNEELLQACYDHLKLLTFYTIKGDEARAWVVPSGIKAVEAAGKIHSDMASGFINAEIINWSTLLEEGSLAKAREKGICRIEGRDYLVKDGDVLFFRFRN
ncbi:MAG: redox-regulated ATPase YchF [Bacillota bacterium]